MITMMVAHDPNRVIGRNGTLPWTLPEDLALFKSMTTGKTVIMGRSTFESILARLGKPLPNRSNIVMSKTLREVPPGVEVSQDLMAVLSRFLNTDTEAVVIGGAKLYQQCLPFVDLLYVSLVKQEYSGDTYFPAYDNPLEYEEIARVAYNDFDFITYKRNLI
jgi:dihydrofolate reductase